MLWLIPLVIGVAGAVAALSDSDGSEDAGDEEDEVVRERERARRRQRTHISANATSELADLLARHAEVVTAGQARPVSFTELRNFVARDVPAPGDVVATLGDLRLDLDYSAAWKQREEEIEALEEEIRFLNHLKTPPIKNGLTND
jgi:hypothetical protein